MRANRYNQRLAKELAKRHDSGVSAKAREIRAENARRTAIAMGAIDDYDEDRTVPVDEYIRRELGWRDIIDEDDDTGDLEVGSFNPMKEFFDGPYLDLGPGCHRRMPCGGMDDE